MRHFRNLEEVEVHFSPKLNAIVGENAQGKTNLLEAVLLISLGRSFRTEHLNEAIQAGKSFFYIEAKIVQESVDQTVKLFFDGQTKKLQIDGNAYTTYSPLLGLLPATLSAPEDMDLISGAPALRRRFLNLHLAQGDPLYVHHYARFWRAMKHRNLLLRGKSHEGISCFEVEMVHSARYLAEERQKFLEALSPPLLVQGRRLSCEEEEVELRPHASFQIATYLQQLEKSRPREQELGQTLHGPHRDDFSFWLGDKPVRSFASEGQKKTAVTALRLAAWECLTTKIGFPHLLAVDDFGGMLDSHRRALFRKSLNTKGQVFVTAPECLEDAEGVYRVERGKVESLGLVRQ